VLREAGVLVAEREGKEIYFHVNKAFLQHAFGKSAYLDTALSRSARSCEICSRSFCGLAAAVPRRVSGALPGTQRLLVVANHESFLDGLLLGLFLPLDPVFVVHTGVVRNPVFRLLLGLVDYLAVDPTSPMAMKKVIRLIESGRPVVIFPEGRITTTGSLMKTYDGPAFVAAKTGATILPVRIDGAARTYFSRLAAHVPRACSRRSACSCAHHAIPMPEAPPPGAPPQGRRSDAAADAGDDLRHPPHADPLRGPPRRRRHPGPRPHAGRGHEADRIQLPRPHQDVPRAGAGGRPPRQPARQGRPAAAQRGAHAGAHLRLTAHRRTVAMLNYTAGVDGMQAACTAAQIGTVISSRAFVEQAKLGDKLAALDGVRIVWLEDLRDEISLPTSCG
jgi:acyl-[acyl-carrier-protein]-phospholipid O-acyltransferase/long-chain-fatty-acid--[acyl-carrier-protein] ligase